MTNSGDLLARARALAVGESDSILLQNYDPSYDLKLVNTECPLKNSSDPIKDILKAYRTWPREVLTRAREILSVIIIRISAFPDGDKLSALVVEACIYARRELIAITSLKTPEALQDMYRESFCWRIELSNVHGLQALSLIRICMT